MRKSRLSKGGKNAKKFWITRCWVPNIMWMEYSGGYPRSSLVKGTSIISILYNKTTREYAQKWILLDPPTPNRKFLILINTYHSFCEAFGSLWLEKYYRRFSASDFWSTNTTTTTTMTMKWYVLLSKVLTFKIIGSRILVFTWIQILIYLKAFEFLVEISPTSQVPLSFHH
jgi:hypothetical protein